MTLELGGSVRGLKFNVGTLKCLRDITGIDPFEYNAEGTDFATLLPYATNITYAALLSTCLSKKVDADFTATDVEAWVDELTVGELTDIVNHYNEIFVSTKASANGEVGKDTQPGQVVNV